MATRQPWMKTSPLFGVRVPGDGPKPALAMFIGERPGKQEPAQGRPFVGAAGQEFNRYLGLGGFQRGDVYVTNIVKDYRDEDPTEEEICRDLPELMQEIDDVSPYYLVPMGRFAIRHFMGDVDVEQVHGLAFDGDVYGYPGKIIYPTFHPAAGLHNGDTVPFIADDFRGLADIDNRLWIADTLPQDYGRQTGKDWLRPELPLALDTEWAKTHTLSLQFCQSPGVARVAHAGPTADSFRRDFNHFWSAGGRVVLHNSLADLKPLRELGVHVRDGQFVDTMVLSYLLQLYPQGLKPLAFRLCGMTMKDYSEVMAPYRPSLHQEWLEMAKAVADDLAPPEPELVWDDKKAAWRIKQPQTIAQRLKRIEGDLGKGKTVDIAERVSNWEDSAAAALIEEIGEVPEPSLADVRPSEAEEYASRDPDATLRIAPILLSKIKEKGLEEVCEIDHAILPMVDFMQDKGMLIDPGHFEALGDRLTGEMDAKRDEIGEMVGIRINPGSDDQVRDLLFKQFKFPPRKWTGGGEESTQAKVLEAMRHDHPVIPLILEYRGMAKVRDSFCRKMPRLAGADNRVRPNIRVTRVFSGRLATNTPNLMAIPVRSKLGRELRQGFICQTGNKIGSWDLDQIEMREIADLTNDPFLRELFHDSSRDIHSETAARMFDKPVAQIDPKTERYAAKRVGFGIATQITGAGLVDQMELAGATHSDGSRWTEEECNALIELWFGVYPEVRRFIDRTKSQVRRDGFVRDRWGRIRYLEGVWSTISRIREESLRQGPSHRIQAGAQGLMKRAMARCWRMMEEYGLIELGVWPLLQIHDSLMFEYPEELEGTVNEVVMDALQNTTRYSVPITASGESGLNWGQMGDIEEC